MYVILPIRMILWAYISRCDVDMIYDTFYSWNITPIMWWNNSKVDWLFPFWLTIAAGRIRVHIHIHHANSQVEKTTLPGSHNNNLNITKYNMIHHTIREASSLRRRPNWAGYHFERDAAKVDCVDLLPALFLFGSRISLDLQTPSYYSRIYRSLYRVYRGGFFFFFFFFSLPALWPFTFLRGNPTKQGKQGPGDFFDAK